MTSSLRGRALALIAGAAFTGGALTILLGPALLTPWDWSSYHVLTVLSVFGTIAAGHLLAEAGFKNPVAAIGFLILFVGGTGLVVANSVGRQATAFQETNLSAEATNTAITEKLAELKSARARRDFADAQVQKEMTGSRCGKRCRDWKTNSADISVVIGQLEASIRSLGPQKPVNAKAERMADLAALFGISKAKAMAMYILLEPLLNCLFYELGSIVSLGFAFRQGKRPLVAANDQLPKQINTIASVAEQLPEAPEPPKGKRRKPLPREVIDFSNHPVVKALRENGGSVASHQELARLLNMDEGAASRRRQEVEDQLCVTRHGKQLRISLKAA
ncbi:hypothetical protein DLM45_02375 [Hyphomicrobium methylovorum]|uniref:hypothetical protein n=1 Tax=Hyphomicrobium methylovorum TaxID=84 RepID=UPI0015E66794|nr:hypothetical protein [Hyphomicrobium methylovorum]MBA2125072.1 hypothetical protein [Hyphomicrobium methylovorum]